MTNYAWAPGSPFKGDANEVKAELDRISRAGGLTPEAIVLAARPPQSILHRLIYHTSDEDAAERYWLSRASSLIKAVVVVNEGEVTHMRAYARVVEVGVREWKSTSLPDVRTIEIERLTKLIRRIRRQIDELNVYEALGPAIDSALEAAA